VQGGSCCRESPLRREMDQRCVKRSDPVVRLTSRLALEGGRVDRRSPGERESSHFARPSDLDLGDELEFVVEDIEDPYGRILAANGEVRRGPGCSERKDGRESRQRRLHKGQLPVSQSQSRKNVPSRVQPLSQLLDLPIPIPQAHFRLLRLQTTSLPRAHIVALHAPLPADLHRTRPSPKR
jgi:hypothetical protein